MPKILLIQGSLSPTSKTALVVEETAAALKEKNVDCEIVDLRELKMEFCDGRPLKEYNQDVQDAYRKMEEADAYVFGMPVYCYSVSGALKNFIDIVSGAMETKPKYAGILCNMGGVSSFMACGDLIKILSFESHVLSVQPIPHSNANDFADGKLTSDKVRAKIRQMVDSLLRVLP